MARVWRAAYQRGGLSGRGGRAAETVHASNALATVVSLLRARPVAEVMDLGPVVGSNVTFLGERVGCRIHVEDLYADIDRHVEPDGLEQLSTFLRGRFPLPEASIDAVLGWDVFDRLAPLPARVLAEELVRILRPGGMLLGLFAAHAADDQRTTTYVIEDDSHLRSRTGPAAGDRRRWVRQNRDITILFAGLELRDAVLLKSGVREILFRKPFPFALRQ